jgi:hypothetical protein
VGRWCGSIPAMSTYRRKQQARQPGAQHRAERQARRERAAELFAQGRSRPRSPASWTSRARARAAGTLAGKPRGHGVAEPRTDGPATQDSRPCLGRDRAVAGGGRAGPWVRHRRVDPGTDRGGDPGPSWRRGRERSRRRCCCGRRCCARRCARRAPPCSLSPGSRPGRPRRRRSGGRSPPAAGGRTHRRTASGPVHSRRCRG